jgi:hypothetical protein
VIKKIIKENTSQYLVKISIIKEGNEIKERLSLFAAWLPKHGNDNAGFSNCQKYLNLHMKNIAHTLRI